MNQTEAKIFELLKNEEFVLWVVSPTDKSTHYWLKWIKAEPQRREWVEKARSVILSSQKKSFTMPEQGYRMVLQNLVDHANTKKSEAKVLSLNFWRPIGIAASVLIIFAIGIFSLIDGDQKSDSNGLLSEMVVKSTLAGQKLTIRLPDGTLVKLNASSKIIAPKHFSSTTREVSLTGEAFFEVTRDESRPFVITGGGMEVRVLGTSFVVRNDQGSRNKLVAVKTGRVAIKDTGSSEVVNLVANEMSVLSTDKSLAKTSIERPEVVFGWVDNKMVFQESSFDQVIADIQRWYGIEVEVQSNINTNLKYTATYENPTLEEVLLSLSHVYSFKYENHDQYVVIK